MVCIKSSWMHACAPGSHVAGADWLRRLVPRTRDLAAGQTLEVELTADFRLGTARVRHVVAVERHHVTKHVRVAAMIYKGTTIHQ